MRKFIALISALILLSLPALAQTNLYNPATATPNTYIDANGNTQSFTGVDISGAVLVSYGTQYVSSVPLQIGGSNVCFFSDKQATVKIACYNGTQWENLRTACTPFTPPDAATQSMRYSILDSDLASSMLVSGTTCPTTYIPYTAPVLPAPSLVVIPIANQTYNAAPFTVSATTNSASPVTFSVVSGPAAVSGSTVTLSGVNGTVVIQAHVASDGTYAASSATSTFVVSGAPRTGGFVVVSGTSIFDANGSPATNATLCAAPVNATGQPLGIQAGGGGQVVKSPVCTQVTNGAFSFRLPDTSLTAPQNACFAVTVVDNTSGNPLLDAGYGCVQPTSASGSNWCSTGAGVPTCNFDNYVPSEPTLAVVQVGATGPVGPAGPAGNNGTGISTLQGKKVYVYGDSLSSIRGPIWQNQFVALTGALLYGNDARPGRAWGSMLEGYGAYCPLASITSLGTFNGSAQTDVQPQCSFPTGGAVNREGAGGASGVDWTVPQTGQTLAQSLAGVDLIIIALGTNDSGLYNGGPGSTGSIGSVNDGYTAGTEMGNINFALDAIQAANPAVRVLIVGNQFWSNNGATLTGSAASNQDGTQASSYVMTNSAATTTAIQYMVAEDAALRQIAAYRGVPYLSLLQNEGLYQGNIGLSTVDGTHPTNYVFQHDMAPLIARAAARLF